MPARSVSAVEAFLAEHPDGEAVAAEHRLEGLVEHVEAAGIGAEGRQHEAQSITDEARAADHVTVGG